MRTQENISLILLIAALSFLLLGCTQASNSRDVNYFTGTGTMTLDFAKSSPPEQVYEGSDVNVGLLVQNQGAISVSTAADGDVKSHAELSISYDPFYFSFTPVFNPLLNQLSDENNPLNIMLHGRSYGYPQGETRFIDYGVLHSKQIQGTRQIPTSQVFVNLCYPYKTILDTDVCIDVSNIYPSGRAQVCTGQDLSFSGQGSPVKVSSVTPEVLPMLGKAVPVFKITLENAGTGTLLAPVSPDNMNTACKLQDSKRDSWSLVTVNASLFGKKLDCSPANVSLVDGTGFTRCTFSQASDYIPTQSNYQTQLHVELSYVYVTSVSKQITILRNPDLDQNQQLPTATAQQSCIPGPYEVKVGDACVPKCDFCKNPVNQNDPACQLTVANNRFYQQPGLLNENFSCGCARSDCIDKEKTGKCLFNMCPGSFECCI